MNRKNMKEHLEIFVICKKCGHGARLYHNPGGGVIKSCKGAPAVPIIGSPDSTKFLGWVAVVCKHQGCGKFNKPVFLSERDFESLSFRPCCDVCGTTMQPERERQGKGNYVYRCGNARCNSVKSLSDFLPDWKKVL
jgi:hypothetical protein